MTSLKSMTCLKIQNLSVEFKQTRILHDISFEAKAGELIGLLGPNGAGKSTLMRTAAGLLPAQGGIQLCGHSLDRLSAHQKAKYAAFLPQGREVNWGMSVKDVVALGRTPHRCLFASPDQEDLQQIEQALVRMDVAHLSSRSVLELSGGELARVLMARVLAQNTPLILADEPAAGLDPAHQIALMHIFSELAQEGRGILVSLHDLSLAARWCSRIILMDQGQIIADGAAQDVLTPERLASVYHITAHFSQDEKGMMIIPTNAC